ncbi:MAG: hypothetical protein ACFB10_03895 [Salibacteraceae bacterium]
MSFADDLFRKLFPSKTKGFKVPIDSGLLERSAKDIAEYNHWQENDEHLPLLKKVHHAYHMDLAGLQNTINLHRYTSREANGFYFTYQPDMGITSIEFLFDLMRDRVLSKGYYLYVSDRKAEEKGEKIITTHRHYLKPPGNAAGITRQLYGNVLIELVWTDRQPSYLKLMAQVYQDSRFDRADEFEELVEVLLAH